MQNVLARFEESRDRIFLIEAPTGRSWTYAEFRGASIRAANFLAASGVQSGDRVLFVLPNSAELAQLYFGCLFLFHNALVNNKIVSLSSRKSSLMPSNLTLIKLTLQM